MLDKSFQDVEFGADFKCTGGCKTGVLLRAEKTPTGHEGRFRLAQRGRAWARYAVTLDANGKELTRERLRPGGGLMRVAPTAAEARRQRAARDGGAGRGARGAARRRRACAARQAAGPGGRGVAARVRGRRDASAI